MHLKLRRSDGNKFEDMAAGSDDVWQLIVDVMKISEKMLRL